MHKKERNFGWSVLKYRPLTTAQHQQGLNELAQKNSSLRLDGTDFVRSTTFDQITSQVLALSKFPTINIRDFHTEVNSKIYLFLFE